MAALAQGERELLSSFEMPWKSTHDKLCWQAIGGLYFDRLRLKQCDGKGLTVFWLCYFFAKFLALRAFLNQISGDTHTPSSYAHYREQNLRFS